MNFNLFTIALLALHQNTLALRNPIAIGIGFIEDRIKDATRCVATGLSAGILGCGTLSFDPLTIDELEVDFSKFEDDSLTGVLKLNNLTLDDITRFSMEQVNLGNARLHTTILWNRLELNTDYQLEDFQYENTPASGNGSLSLAVINLRAKADIQVTFPIKIRSCSIMLSVESIENFNITGFRYKQSDVSKMISLLAKSKDMQNLVFEVLNKVICAEISDAVNNKKKNVNAIACLAEKCFAKLPFL